MSRAEALEQIVATADPSQLPDLAGDLSRALALVYSRISAAAASVATPTQKLAPNDTRLLTVKEAAVRLGCSPKWLYQRNTSLPFARKIGGLLRFDLRGLERYIEAQRTDPDRRA